MTQEYTEYEMVTPSQTPAVEVSEDTPQGDVTAIASCCCETNHTYRILEALRTLQTFLPVKQSLDPKNPKAPQMHEFINLQTETYFKVEKAVGELTDLLMVEIKK